MRRYVERSAFIGLLTILVGIIILLATTALTGPLRVITDTLGSVAITIGLLSLVYDALLQDILAAEIFSKLELRTQITRSGLEDIGSRSTTELWEKAGKPAAIKICPLHPMEWATTDFENVLNIAATEATEVVVYLPAPDPDVVSALALRTGGEADILQDLLSKLPDELAEGWDVKGIDNGSRLTVHHLQGVPGYGWIEAGDLTLVNIGPMVAFPRFGRESECMIFRSASAIAARIRSDLATLDPPPSVAQIRPLADDPRHQGAGHA